MTSRAGSLDAAWHTLEAVEDGYYIQPTRLGPPNSSSART
jgi:hypothetical protein